KRIRQFIDNHPDSQLTKYLIFWLGQYYYDNSLYELSRNNFGKVITNYPQDKKFTEEAQYETGLCYLAENKTEDAFKVFNKLSQETNNALLKIKATLALADLLYQSDRIEEAIKMYNEVVNLASKSKTAKEKDKTGVEFDSLLDYTGEETEPLESDVFTGAKDKDSDSAINILTAAYVRLGDLYKENKDFDSAIYAYRQAVKNTKEGSKVYLQFEIGECFEEKNDLDLAIEEYLKIPYLSEQDKFIVVKGLLRCANIYEDREDWKKAITMYERMLNYDTPETKYAKERIESIKNQTGRH
ncbi:MAG: tetratricopeptide repeat protein, partial [Candidatus Omnitrophica bacterium]|nr:tetratricopeptide repeat protein [Candidatus Omnitrophota bacterium]